MNHLGAWLAVALTAAGTASADWGYLPRVGPAALRFQAPPKPRAELKSLPPLELPQPELASDQPLRPSSTNLAAATPPVSPDGHQPDAAGTAASPSVEAPTQDEGALTPQMLVKFFVSNPTNAPANAVFVPVGFRPPQASAPVSSKATYTTAP